MRANKKLLTTVAMMLVSVLLLSTASYAWFTMSYEAEFGGIQLTVQAPTNLLISKENNISDQSKWKQSESFIINEKNLAPASSYYGDVFFAPTKYAKSGAPTTSTLFENVTAKSNTNFKYYIDVTMYVANAGTQEPIGITMDSLQASVTNGSGSGDDSGNTGYKSIRIAVVNYTLNNNGSGSNSSSYNGTETQVIRHNVLKHSLSGFGQNIKDFDGTTTGATVAGPFKDEAPTVASEASDYTGVADVSNDQNNTANLVDDKSPIVTLPKVDSTGLYGAAKLTVRIWFEGQDASSIDAMKFNNPSSFYTVQFIFKVTTIVQDDEG